MARLLGLGALGCLLLGCGDVASRGALLERFEALHRRIYDVYALHVDRDEVWSHLAQSFSGEALTQEYLEHFTTLAQMRRDGTSIRVLSIDYDKLSLEQIDGAPWVVADWSVGGIVTHQGHRHPRVNRYRAAYRMGRGVDGELRIAETKLLRLERVRNADLGAFPLDDLPKTGRGFMSLTDLVREGVVDVKKSDIKKGDGVQGSGKQGDASQPPGAQ